MNFRERTAYLCEVTYSRTLSALLERLEAWSRHWVALRQAMVRDCFVPEEWELRPWLFIPKDHNKVLDTKLPTLVALGDGLSQMPKPRVTHLESVVPWKYRNWDRKKDAVESDA